MTVASLDPDVDMIRMTGYRLGRKSAMAEALMEAAKRVLCWHTRRLLTSSRARTLPSSLRVALALMSFRIFTGDCTLKAAG